MGNEIETRKNAAMARPSYIPEGNTGTEHIGKDDMQMPRLALAQALSPQLSESKPEFIDGLKAGHMFNTLSKEIYGKGPMDFVILRADPPRGIEFNPRAQGGGVKDPNVPLNDPRMQFTKNEQGESVNPIATKFYDYIVMIVRETGNDMVALSLKGSGLRVARSLNGLIKLRNAPLYAGVYRINSVLLTGGKGEYYSFNIVNNGWVSTAEYDTFKGLYDGLKDVKVVINREDDPGDANEDLAHDM